MVEPQTPQKRHGASPHPVPTKRQATSSNIGHTTMAASASAAVAAPQQQDAEFPCSLDLLFPFPSARLATAALQAIQVDPELSPLIRRQMSVVPPNKTNSNSTGTSGDAPAAEENILRVEYRATTNRMLRVAVNTFMESMKLVVEVMEKLDVDVIPQPTAHYSTR